MKRIAVALSAIILLAFAGSGRAGGAAIARDIVLFGGSNTDSTEQLSAWVSVRGAKRIYIRTWSTHSAFTFTATDTASGGTQIVSGNKDADSTFSDTLTAFVIQFSDSICCQVTGPGGRTISSAADSIVIPVTIVGDTTKAMAAVYPLPVNKQLRGAANGSGLISVVFPTRPGSVASTTPVDEGGMIPKGFMRVRCTPLRRNTVSGGNSTAGKRVVGLKGFRMVATVYTEIN
jgi:hypothetical protein